MYSLIDDSMIHIQFSQGYWIKSLEHPAFVTSDYNLLLSHQAMNGLMVGIDYETAGQL